MDGSAVGAEVPGTVGGEAGGVEDRLLGAARPDACGGVLGPGRDTVGGGELAKGWTAVGTAIGEGVRGLVAGGSRGLGSAVPTCGSEAGGGLGGSGRWRTQGVGRVDRKARSAEEGSSGTEG